MNKVAITSFKNDPHALAVAWGIQKLGCIAEILYFNALIDYHKISLRLDVTQTEIDILQLSHGLEKYDVVWWRRVPEVSLPTDLHSSDMVIAQREWAMLQRSLINLVAKSVDFSVNPPAEFHAAGLKPYQLLMAKKAGFSIPKTLISNNAASISEFIARNENTIFKTSCPSTWISESGGHAELTATLINSIEGIEESAKFSPGIFQEYIKKAYEVRLVVMGKTLFAYEIDSQSDKASEIDWRARPAYTAGIVYARKVPDDIRFRVLSLMDALGLSFGSIDFIVTPSDDWVFLEVNASGQFLWLEYDVPQVPLLDAFSKFLIGKTIDFHYSDTVPCIRAEEFESQYIDLRKEEPSVDHWVHPFVVTE